MTAARTAVSSSSLVFSTATFLAEIMVFSIIPPTDISAPHSARRHNISSIAKAPREFYLFNFFIYGSYFGLSKEKCALNPGWGLLPSCVSGCD